MGQTNLENKYHVNSNGDIFKVNDDGSFTNLGNVEELQNKTIPRKSGISKKNNTIKSTQSKIDSSKQVEVEKKEGRGCLVAIIIMCVIGWLLTYLKGEAWW